jgi:hypothetical protein
MIRALSIAVGDGPYGPPLMKFVLTYEGELRANDSRRKWEIRRQFHPQLRELWRIHPALLVVERHRMVPGGNYFQYEQHHSLPPGPVRSAPPNSIDVLAPIKVEDKQYCPLVRNSLALHCGLKIIFLRKEEPGKIYQGGDLDNRLKTLFDALSVPNRTEPLPKGAVIEDPLYCLLEDDALITRIDVETQRLLSRPKSSAHEAHLIIEVDVRPTEARIYNQPFLGD